MMVWPLVLGALAVGFLLFSEKRESPVSGRIVMKPGEKWGISARFTDARSEAEIDAFEENLRKVSPFIGYVIDDFETSQSDPQRFAFTFHVSGREIYFDTGAQGDFQILKVKKVG
jgi:hypothetical protein